MAKTLEGTSLLKAIDKKNEGDLLDDDDLYYLELSRTEIKSADKSHEFKEYIFDDPDITLRSMITYCYGNFMFAAKVLLGVELLPFQAVTLEQMFNKNFFCLVASRGYSKTTRDCYIVTEDGFVLINDCFNKNEALNENFVYNKNILGENGFHKPKYKWKATKKALKLKTSTGNEIIGSEIHPIRVVSNGIIVWKKLSEIKKGDYTVIDRNHNDLWYKNDNGLPEDVAYMFGCLIGDGGYTVRGHITLTNGDKEVAEVVSDTAKKLWGKPFKQQKRKITSLLCGVDIWDELFNKYGFNSSVCGEKDFPKSIMSAPKNSVKAFIRGLFDTDGTVAINGSNLSYSTKSKNLAKTLKFVLSRLGIISSIKKEYNKQYDRYYYGVYINGDDAREFKREIGLTVKKKKDRLAKIDLLIPNTNIDIVPMEMVSKIFLSLKEKAKVDKITYTSLSQKMKDSLNSISLDQKNMSYERIRLVLNELKYLEDEPEYIKIKEIYDSRYFYDEVTEVLDIGEKEMYDFSFDEEDHSYISNGFISHNSFLLAVYSLLRAILMQGSRIVLISASFRQSKVVFNYINDIYKASPALQQIAGKQKPRFDISGCSFQLGNSSILSIPLGNGEKVRGLRGNCIDGDSLVATTVGMIKIKDAEQYMGLEHFKVYTGSGDGETRNPEYFFKTEPMSGYIISFENGARITCSLLHALHTKDYGIVEAVDLEVGMHFDTYDKEGVRCGATKIKDIAVLGRKQSFYDFTIPNEHSFIANGIKNRNCILVDEFAAIPHAIFETVVRGFSVVALDPVGKVKERYRMMEMEKEGIDVSSLKEEQDGNQIIISGTAYYQFNHFYQYYKQYNEIIECGNDRAALRALVGEDMTPEELDSLDPDKFGVLHVPYYALPPAYLDDSIISQGKATMTKAGFDMEFGAIFYADSDGFIPMSLLESVSMYIKFGPVLKGVANKRYVMGVDPARQRDHFSIVVIEIDDSGDGQHRVVYCWATNEKKMKKTGEVNEQQTYYGACARKIRHLSRAFNLCLINIDAGGGGREIANYLQEQKFLLAKEEPFWEFDNPDHRMYVGRHILKITPSSTQFVQLVNHSFRKAVEEFQLLMPIYDTVAIEAELDSEQGAVESMTKMTTKTRVSMIDTIEDVNEEIQSMKDEIASIIVTETTGGNQKFDLPKMNSVGGDNKTTDKRRKDRYSACLLAHNAIQYVISEEHESNYQVDGGTAENLASQKQDGAMYRGLPTGVTRNVAGPVAVSIDKSGGSGSVSY